MFIDCSQAVKVFTAVKVAFSELTSRRLRDRVVDATKSGKCGKCSEPDLSVNHPPSSATPAATLWAIEQVRNSDPRLLEEAGDLKAGNLELARHDNAIVVGRSAIVSNDNRIVTGCNAIVRRDNAIGSDDNRIVAGHIGSVSDRSNIGRGCRKCDRPQYACKKR